MRLKKTQKHTQKIDKNNVTDRLNFSGLYQTVSINILQVYENVFNGNRICSLVVFLQKKK